MKHYIDPGRARPSINFIDNIVYSHSLDLTGKPLDLKLSIMLQNGNSEMKLAAGKDDTKRTVANKPAILWIPGGGYRGVDKNLMVAEVMYLVEAGFVVASMYYRGSHEAHFPAQLIDVKTAIRFLRANAERYEIDPDRIGVMGRSAGGHLSALAAMNIDGYDSPEWAGVSSKVQAAYDLFGPVDMVAMIDKEAHDVQQPNYRWHKLEDTHPGALLGGDPYTMRDRAQEASVECYISSAMAPILIMHGDADPLVPLDVSERFYQQLCAVGLEDKADLYVLKHGGHGTPEFFQPQTKQIALDFFCQRLNHNAISSK
ncbi:alpha/beta hydrolase [Vibrio porteresiae]|uniref:Alpha/beta hydrolase n=1 Tax=Vibrio porteresiae DSM 19223 TaxID=1123496 RepID=A0ABZ0QJX5_9VIBR|nr:alpha/beta hydrolase [Vibrio porteresiae]WPC76326.1 alpha/beta hydrolase [Vibrio porteresiae DSM 19223]